MSHDAIILIVQSVVLMFYLVWIQYEFGSLPSISESAYHVAPKGLAFTLFCWILGVTQILDGGTAYLISGLGFMYCGVAWMFKETKGPIDEIHYVGAVVGIFAGIYPSLTGGFWYLGIPIALTWIVLFRHERKIYWIEVVSAFIIMVGKGLLLCR